MPGKFDDIDGFRLFVEYKMSARRGELWAMKDIVVIFSRAAAKEQLPIHQAPSLHCIDGTRLDGIAIGTADLNATWKALVGVLFN